MDSEFDYDFFVIGGGSGGLASAVEAAKQGKKVAVCDFVKPTPKGSTWGIGGTCVNVGCIPKKLFHFASHLGQLRKDIVQCGWDVDLSQEHNWSKMQKHVYVHIKKTNWRITTTLMKDKIKYFNKQGKIVGKNKVELSDGKGNVSDTITAKYILIATGGRPRYLDSIPNIRDLAITSDDIFWKKEAPGKTLVIGSGYIGCELSGALSGMGYDVTMLVRSKILRGFDSQMVDYVKEGLKSVGVKFQNGNIKTLTRGEDGKIQATWVNKEGASENDAFDTLILAIGRTPAV